MANRWTSGPVVNKLKYSDKHMLILKRQRDFLCCASKLSELPCCLPSLLEEKKKLDQLKRVFCSQLVSNPVRAGLICWLQGGWGLGTSFFWPASLTSLARIGDQANQENCSRLVCLVFFFSRVPKGYSQIQRFSVTESGSLFEGISVRPTQH